MGNREGKSSVTARMRAVDRVVLDGLPAEQRRIAQRRLDILFRLFDRRRTGEALTAATEQLARQLTREHPRQPMSARTLHRWLMSYRRGGVEALVDGRAGAVRKPPRKPVQRRDDARQCSEILDHLVPLLNAVAGRWGLQVTRRSECRLRSSRGRDSRWGRGR